MMNVMNHAVEAKHSITPFDFNGNNVRVITRGEEPWFVAKDVAEILGYANPQKAVRDHCKRAQPVGVNESFILDPQTVIIPEGDLYRLIARSKLPAAEEFEVWLYDEVLPSIRKHGAFMTDAVIEQTLTDPDYLIQLATTIKQERQARMIAEADNKKLNAKAALDAPKVAYADDVVGKTEGLITLGDFGRVLKDKGFSTGARTIFAQLRKLGVIMKSKSLPYDQFINAGYFKTGQKVTQDRIYPMTFVTGKGEIFIHELLMESI